MLLPPRAAAKTPLLLAPSPARPIPCALAAVGAMLKEHGAHNYSIALLEDPAGSGGGMLFGYVEIECETRWALVKDTEVCKRWWAWMTEFIQFHADGTPAATPLRELFFLP